MSPSDVLAAVYERFAPAEAELPNGFAEHAPMGAEAMLQLGVAPQRVLAWAERHQPSTSPVASSARIRSERSTILAEIDADGWRAVVTRRATELLANLDVHLYHGAIRTAHVVRALEGGVGPAGHLELATALASWTAWAEDAPARPVPGEWSVDPVERLLDAAARGAAAHLERPSIVTIHAVTAPMAILLLDELVDRSALAVGASVIDETHRRYPPLLDGERAASPAAEARVELVALEWDAHPAKLVEAAERAHLATGEWVFREVVERVVDRIVEP